MKFEVEHGKFEYSKEKQILSDINFFIEEREVLSILGSNGVGKTTLLKCMLGLLKWSEGQTKIDGKNIKTMKYNEVWKTIGYVPQAKISTFAYTVDEMILLGRNSHLKLFEQPNTNDKKIAAEALKQIGMERLKGKLCSKISGGELQMVLIARALASQPKLLILDEPESNLDFKNQLIVLETIKGLCKERGISSIVNTHYPEHAISISDKAMILNRDGSSVFGNADKVIDENKLKKAFDVNVKIEKIKINKEDFACVLPISIVGEKESERIKLC